MLLAVASSIVFGLVPAWRASKTDINTTLKEAVRGAGARGARDIVRSALIAAEVALALVLLVGAGLAHPQRGRDAARPARDSTRRACSPVAFSLPAVEVSVTCSR